MNAKEKLTKQKEDLVNAQADEVVDKLLADAERNPERGFADTEMLFLGADNYGSPCTHPTFIPACNLSYCNRCQNAGRKHGERVGPLDIAVLRFIMEPIRQVLQLNCTPCEEQSICRGGSYCVISNGISNFTSTRLKGLAQLVYHKLGSWPNSFQKLECIAVDEKNFRLRVRW